jgi:hypothetical protein
MKSEFSEPTRMLPAPIREHPAGMDDHPRGRDGRIPVEVGLLHPGTRRAEADPPPGVMPAVGDHRPAVVRAAADAVDLVAAPRAVFGEDPEIALEIERRALRVAVAVAPDLGARARRPTKGLSAGTLPSRLMRTTVPLWLPDPARWHVLAPVADGEEEPPIRRLDDAAAEMPPAARSPARPRRSPAAPSSRSDPSAQRATASAVPAPRPCRMAKLRKTSRERAKSRGTITSRRPPCPPPRPPAGPTGAWPARPRAAVSRPSRSVTRKPPPGRKASPQGSSSPLRTRSTRNAAARRERGRGPRGDRWRPSQARMSAVDHACALPLEED